MRKKFHSALAQKEDRGKLIFIAERKALNKEQKTKQRSINRKRIHVQNKHRDFRELEFWKYFFSKHPVLPEGNIFFITKASKHIIENVKKISISYIFSFPFYVALPAKKPFFPVTCTLPNLTGGYRLKEVGILESQWVFFFLQRNQGRSQPPNYLNLCLRGGFTSWDQLFFSFTPSPL